MQPATGNILILYGHGGVTDANFDFRRPSGQKVVLYAWTREGIEIWDSQMKLVADEALTQGTISDSYSNRTDSRIGGSRIKDMVIEPPVGLALPTWPAAYTTSGLPGLGAHVDHDGPTLDTSTRMVFMMDPVPGAVQPQLMLSAIIGSPVFSARPFDVLWCACKGNV